MICMSTSLPTSIKLPKRIAGCAAPEGTCKVPCAAATDATASSSTPTNAPCVNRFIVSPLQCVDREEYSHVLPMHRRLTKQLTRLEDRFVRHTYAMIYRH